MANNNTPLNADEIAGIYGEPPATVRGLRSFVRHIAGSSPLTGCGPVICFGFQAGEGPVAEVWAGTMARTTVTHGG